MGRLIVLALAVAALLWWLRRPGSRADEADTPAPGAGEGVQALVRCAHCGIHLPGDEARMQDGQAYCSADHARLGPARDAS